MLGDAADVDGWGLHERSRGCSRSPSAENASSMWDGRWPPRLPTARRPRRRKPPRRPKPPACRPAGRLVRPARRPDAQPGSPAGRGYERAAPVPTGQARCVVGSPPHPPRRRLRRHRRTRAVRRGARPRWLGGRAPRRRSAGRTRPGERCPPWSRSTGTAWPGTLPRPLRSAHRSWRRNRGWR